MGGDGMSAARRFADINQHATIARLQPLIAAFLGETDGFGGFGAALIQHRIKIANMAFKPALKHRQMPILVAEHGQQGLHAAARRCNGTRQFDLAGL